MTDTQTMIDPVTQSAELSSLSLEDLASLANENHTAVHRALSEGVLRAIAAGDALLEARSRVTPGEWVQWCEDNLEIGYQTVKIYLRVATYQDHLREIQPSSVKDARNMLVGLPPVPNLIKGAQKPEHMKKRAKQLVAKGVPLREAAKLVGVSHSTVMCWIDPDYRKQRNAYGRAYRREQQKAKKALERETRAREARQISGPVSEAYASLRKAAAACQAGMDQATDRRLSELLSGALEHLYIAEDSVSEAVRLGHQASA